MVCFCILFSRSDMDDADKADKREEAGQQPIQVPQGQFRSQLNRAVVIRPDKVQQYLIRLLKSRADPIEKMKRFCAMIAGEKP